MVRQILWILWQILWCLPQNLVGLVLFLLHGRETHRCFRGAVVTAWGHRGCASLGCFIFIDRRAMQDRPLLVHEYGHTVQSAVLGWLYLPVISLPSMLWYSLLVEAIGGKDVYADGLSNPAFVEAAEVLKKMYDYTFEGAVSAGAADVNGHFIARDTAIYLNGPWWIANFYKEGNAVDGVLLADVCEVAKNPAYEGGKGEGGLVTTVQGFLAAAKQDDPAKEAAVVKFLQYISEPERVAQWALSSGSMFFVKYDPSPDTTVISQKVTQVANEAAYTILHVNGAFPTAFSTEFPAAVSALILGEVDAQGFVDQLQMAIDMA